MNNATEVSAGGVVIRTNGALCELLVIRQRSHKGWGFPKGHIDAGELPEEAALREVEEETGVIAEIIAPLPPTHYIYINKQHRHIKKTVHWYLMRFAGMGAQTHAHEVSNVCWLSLEETTLRLTFENDRELLRNTLQMLQEMGE